MVSELNKVWSIFKMLISALIMPLDFSNHLLFRVAFGILDNLNINIAACGSYNVLDNASLSL